jgi:hypothetical protein
MASPITTTRALHSSLQRSTRSQQPTTTQVDPRTPNVEGTPDDWYTAVCKPGTFDNGQGGLRNADRVAFCVSPKTGTTISIGQYTSEFMARDDAAGPGVKSYALAQTNLGWQLFVSYTDSTGSVLEPLTQFSFEVITPQHNGG